MNIKDKLYEDLKVAMKNKDNISKSTIQLIRAAVIKTEKDKQIQLDDYDVEEILMKERKNRLEEIAMFEKANRLDLVENAYKELAVVNKYLPSTMSEDEVYEEVVKIVEELNANSKMFGQVIGVAKARFGHRVDGKLLCNIIKEVLAKK